MSYVCSTCGQSHEGIPFSFAADFPDEYANLSRDERDLRAVISSDQCIVDSERFYIRGRLEIPVDGEDSPFIWGVWALVYEEVFDELSESWEQAGREKIHGPFKGRLANALTVYPDTFNLKLTLHVQPLGDRPLFVLDDETHPLAESQRKGMSIDDARALVGRIMHPAALASETPHYS